MAKRIAIVGSRDFSAPDVVADYVATLPKDSIVLSGGAKGVDSWAEQAALAHGLKVQIFEADWQNLGAKAGPIRTEMITANADQVTAFWNRKSRGTLNMLFLARESGLPVKIYDAEKNEVSMAIAMQAAQDLGVIASIEKARRKQDQS